MYATEEMLPIRMYFRGLLINLQALEMAMLPFEFKYRASQEGPRAKDWKEMKESTKVIVEVLQSTTFPHLQSHG